MGKLPIYKTMMKNLLVIFSFMVVAMTVSAQTESDTYISMYDSVETVTDKLEIVREAPEEDGANMGPFYAHVLDRTLVEYSQNSSPLEIRAADSIVRIAVENLGKAEYTDAAPNMWRAVTSISDPLPRASALAALGQVKMANYFPSIKQILLDKNIRPVIHDHLGVERLVYGAIAALENFGDSDGYAPVFFASQGWYSRRIRQQAAAALERISPDPSDSLIAVIKSSTYNYENKLAALNSIAASSVPDEKKAEAAASALSEGWRMSSGNIKDQGILSALREKAIPMIGQYGVPDGNTGIYQLLDRSYKNGYREDEKINAVRTLGALATVDSVTLLSSYLYTMNGLLQDGSLNPVAERLIREIIPALGATRLPEAGPALRITSNINWTTAIKRLVREALQNIPQEQ
jgi:HEAT repeat protein